MAVLIASVRRFQYFQDLMQNVNWHEGTKHILKFNMIDMESYSQAHFQFSKSYFIKYSYCRMIPVNICQILITVLHSIESPSMVDPQWNIWYWGSKWNLHTVCWSVVGLEGSTTSVYFGITYVCLSLVDFLSLLLSPRTFFKIFYFCQKYHLIYTYKVFKKFHVGLQFEWGL